jgi:predicted aspartyl protease
VAILHSRTQAWLKTPSGKTAPVPPAIGLQLKGPCLQVTVTIEEHAGKALLSKGKPSPVPKSGVGLIDTGASNTCIDEQAAQDLGLPVIDVAYIQSASHIKERCNVYPVQIMLPLVTFNSPRTIGVKLAAQGLLVLIGRDILQRCTLFYNGGIGEFTLSL